MSRSTSAAYKSALFRSQTDKTVIVLIKIKHADLTPNLFFCSDNVDVISEGVTYLSYPFIIRLPEDTSDRPPRAKLSIDNIDRTIVAAIRSLTTSPKVEIRIVLADTPDTLEYLIKGLEFTNITYDAFTVEGDMVGVDVLNEQYPKDKFVPAKFPGLF